MRSVHHKKQYDDRDSRKTAITRTINSLLNALSQLAPHPDQPYNAGPLFITNRHGFGAANDHDSMLGSLVMENLLGLAFADAVSDIQQSEIREADETGLDLSTAVDAYDFYTTERSQDNINKVAAHGRGTFARLSGCSISARFNICGFANPALSAFIADLPARMKIERALAYLRKSLKILILFPP